MKTKKSQLSIFIMVGVVMLIIIFSFVYLINSMKGRNMERQVKFLPKSALKNQIDLCVENTGSFALLRLGLQGGRIILPSEYLDDSSLKVAYAYDNGPSLASLEQMSREMSDFINRNMMSCIYKYVDNTQRDYELKYGDVKATTIIADEDVTFEVNFPVDVIENNTVTRIDSFQAVVPVRLKKVHNMINTIIQKRIDTSFELCHDCFYDPEMDLGVVDYGPSTLFVLEDKGSRFKNIESKSGPYRFLFAVRN